MSNSAKYILITLAVLVVGTLGFFGYKYYQYQKAAEAFPTSDTPVVFYEAGYSGQYAVVDKTLQKTVDASRTDGVVIYESVQSPLNIEEKLILATVPEIEGVFLGVTRADGNINLLFTGGTNKAELAVRKDGLVVVVTSAIRPAQEIDISGEGEGKESDVEETYTVEEPMMFPEPIKTPPQRSYPELFAVEIDTGVIRALGAGRNPHFADDGSVIALAPNGIVKIDPATGERTLLLSRLGDPLYGAISKSGLIAALPAPDNMSIEFYNLADESSPAFLGLLELKRQGPFPIAFADDTHFFVRTAKGAAWFYNIPTTELPVATPIAVLSVIE